MVGKLALNQSILVRLQVPEQKFLAEELHMKIERGGFTYEKYGFRTERITVELNPDGSVGSEVAELLKRSFRHGQDICLLS